MQTAPWSVSGSSSYPRSGGHPNQAARRGRNQERDYLENGCRRHLDCYQRGFGASIAATGDPTSRFKMFLLLYVSCLALIRWYDMRKSFLTDLAPSLAAARV